MKIESNVNNYSKVYPTIFEYAEGDHLIDDKGKKFIDFFSGAGTLNYGHNNAMIKKSVIEFLEKNYPLHCLDMDTKVKLNFLTKFKDVILVPRGLNYKIQFPSPSGTNAVEAAIKLARKVTQRSNIVSFTHSYHGMTATALALSASREEASKINPSQNVVFFPYEGFCEMDSIQFMKQMITINGSGVDLPAAVILETVQAEGGVNVGSVKWLRELRKFTAENGILLIVDDIQVGCGRTGKFFSFERAGIEPDLVLLSKSISGYGFPLSLVLLKPELDIWEAGEHNGTFRANNLALHTASESLEFWKNDSLSLKIEEDAEYIEKELQALIQTTAIISAVRGLGMIWGIEFIEASYTSKVAKGLFEKGIMIETCGNKDHVLKILPPLTISRDNLSTGINLIKETIFEIAEGSLRSKSDASASHSY